MQLDKNQILPILIVILSGITAIYFRPILTIDETRYFGVAWEMFNSKDFLVPHINGLPYDHKTPLLMWLTNIMWAIFGTDSSMPRAIPILFSIGNLILSWKIYKLLWKSDSTGANLVMWIMAGSIIYTFYSTLFMFDIMLSFWVLLTIYGMILAAQKRSKKAYLLISFAIAFGILAKGFVVIIPLIPIYIFAYYWANADKEFYIKVFLYGFIGLIIAMFWAIPAAIEGGKEYALGIFWRQYVGRAVHSFAHKRAFWWYIPVLLIYILPWILTSPFYIGAKNLIKKRVFDKELYLILIWLFGSLFLFSILSGKQFHYLMPELAAFSILISRFFSLSDKKIYKAVIVGILYLSLGVAFILIPFFVKGYLLVYIDNMALYISGTILTVYGISLIFIKFKDILKFSAFITFGTFILIFTVHYILHIYLSSQDLTNFSKTIKELEDKNISIIHYGKYHDQYQYYGKLTKPLIIISDTKTLRKLIKQKPQSALIIYLDRKKEYNKSVILNRAKLRTHNILLLKSQNYKKLFKK